MGVRFNIDSSRETVSWVQMHLRQNRGGWIYGPIGSGKSYAVRNAGLGGICLDVVPGPLSGQRFATDLARQLGADGRTLLEVVKRDGLAAGLAAEAERAINGKPLIVDAAEHLLVDPISLDDPAAALWQDDKLALRDWLIGRLEYSPTFLVSRRTPGDGHRRYRHQAPRIRVQGRADESPSWERLARLAPNNPGIFALARALEPLIPSSAFHDLIAEADEVDADIGMLFQRLGQAFRLSAPESWQRVLALLGALGEVPEDVVQSVLLNHVEGEARPRHPELDEMLVALLGLQQLSLVEDRAGRLSVLPTLSEFAIRSLTDQERSEFLPKIAHHLLAPVNNLRGLNPYEADRVLLAHAIFVGLGDVGNAERTAVLHVHGLIDLARRTSINERFSSASQQYESVLRMLQASKFVTTDRTGRRLLSYAQHYYAWNGSRAGVLDDVTCLENYERAVEGWPENTLWHQRVIQTLVRLGRFVDARKAIERGERCSESHPRKYELLRVRPAWTALEAKAWQLSLEFIEPNPDASPDLSLKVANGRDVLLKRWEQGLRCEELTFRISGSDAERRVKLLQPTEVCVRRSTNGWIAEMQELSAYAHAESPGKALEVLARNLGEETRRLIATPTWKLNDKDIRRKGMLLSYVDALNSDIGLHHARERWIVGRIEDQKLIPTMLHLPPVEVSSELMPETTQGLYFAKVPVYRDGVPSGPAAAIEPAGNGFGYGELVRLLARMNEGSE